LTPRIACAAVYGVKKEKMKFLWDKGLKTNVVHVDDVVTAMWRSAIDITIKSGSVYNLSDTSNLDQGTLNSWLGEIFKIETGFQGTIISNFAKLNLQSVTEDVNDKHLQPWSDLCKRAGIHNTPLTPYLDQELLYNNSLSIDGSKIETTGFSYLVPRVSEGLLKEVLQGFIEINVFPSDLFK